MSHHLSQNHPDGNAEALRGNAALIIGHPGHELRVHHWLETARPLTFVLTDGSGRDGRSRLPSTATVLRQTGVRPGTIFGRWTDAEAYQILRTGDVGILRDTVRELAVELEENAISAVVGDAMEGINPTHDLCRYIVDAAVLLTRNRARRNVANFDFIVGGPPPSTQRQNGCARIKLDADALNRKWQAAWNYPELRKEVLIAKLVYGRARFATEVLRPIEPGLAPAFSGQPRYETYGEKRVKAGYYDEVIRHRQHIVPLMEALWRELDLPV